MKYLRELQAKKVFSLAQVTELTKNENTAKSLLQNYKKQGYVVSVRKDLYAAKDLASGNPIPNKFEIGAAVSKTAYISHHSALEFHGVSNQVFFEVTVSLNEKMRGFSFEGITYRPVKSYSYEGVIVPSNSLLIKVTDIEKTVVDCIKDIDLAGGLEELIECLNLIPQLNESKLIEYLSNYDQKYLWQKAGYILEGFRDFLNLSDDFFDRCKVNMGIRKNYLGEGENIVYHPEWRLYAPLDIATLTNEGVDVIV